MVEFVFAAAAVVACSPIDTAAIMAVPMLIYAGLNAGDPAALHGVACWHPLTEAAPQREPAHA